MTDRRRDVADGEAAAVLDCDGVMSPVPLRDPAGERLIDPAPSYFSLGWQYVHMHFDERIRDWVRQLHEALRSSGQAVGNKSLLWSGVSKPLGLARWPSLNPIESPGKVGWGPKPTRSGHTATCIRGRSPGSTTTSRRV